MELRKNQKLAIEKGCEWFNKYEESDKKYFEISGPAGSGKTTVVKTLIENLGIDLENFMFMAYIGKATLALRLSGLKAKTIHQSIYDVSKVPLINNEGKKVIGKYGSPIMINNFILKTQLDYDVKGLVLDEAGMVNEKIAKDILSFKLPLFVLGDLNQLPPIFGDSYFLKKPDVILNEIMRQNKDSAIIYLSQLAIHGIGIPYGTYGGNGECLVIKKSELTDNHLKEADIIICETNSTRDTINNYVRENIYGIRSKNLEIGDKLICRKNNWDIVLKNNSDIALVNGLIGYVTRIYISGGKSPIRINFKPEFCDEEFRYIPIENRYTFLPYEKRKSTNTLFLEGTIFEFAYAITAHSAQGSQYDTVLVYVEKYRFSNSLRSWLYTAITRAKKKLILVL